MQKPVPPVFPDVQIVREEYKFFGDDDPPLKVIGVCILGLVVLTLIRVFS